MPFTIQAAAGTPRILGDGGQATQAVLWSPAGVSVDRFGNLYIADTLDRRIRRVNSDGIITTVAGNGNPDYNGDNQPAASAQLTFPTQAAAGPTGEIYVADPANNRIRKISTNGIITTFAGNGSSGMSGDGGAATAAQLASPRAVAFDPAGNVLILDTNNNKVRRVRTDGRIETIVGTGLGTFSGDDGPAAQASLFQPQGMALDASGNLYIADTRNNRIRVVSRDLTITTIAGRNAAGFDGNSVARLAALNLPKGVAVDADGNLYVADSANHMVRRITPSGVISTVAGTGIPGFSGDGSSARNAQLNFPSGLAIDLSGNIYVADAENHRIRKLTPQGIISTVAGSDTARGDKGPGLAARLFQPSGLAFDALGNLYISEPNNNRIRRVTPDGSIDTIAGTGVAGYSGDNGNAKTAQLNGPNGLAVDRAGNLYVADTGNNLIRRISPQGIISRVAGNGEIGNGGDGRSALEAQLFNPNAVAFDRQGNLYIADSANNRVRRVTPEGIILNFAGDGARGYPGFSGDGDLPGAAMLNYPRSLAIDADGAVYIADFFNNRIRRVAPSGGPITTVAGTVRGSGGDGGLAIQAQLNLPSGIALDANRNLYIADSLNQKIRVVSPNGLIQTVAGTGLAGDAGDGGPAIAAQLSSPRDIVAGPGGVIYFSDQDNDRVRKLTTVVVSLKSVVNAASLVGGAVAPGEIITLFGSMIGPPVGASAQLSPSGLIAGALDGTRVLFDGVAAPLVYVSSTQISAIVPYETTGKAATQIQIEFQGKRSDVLTLPVSDAAPGIFTANGSGAGPGAILNEDGTLNSRLNPAERGSVVVLYATGEGQTDPPGVTGRPSGDILPSPALKVLVRIQGELAEIIYAGAAPGSAGLIQINAVVPMNVVGGDAVPIAIAVGRFSSQSGVTLAVQ